jgi:hypothetical protein
MLIVETIARIRREHFIKGKTIKEIARDLNVSRNTVRKVLRSGETSFEVRTCCPAAKPLQQAVKIATSWMRRWTSCAKSRADCSPIYNILDDELAPKHSRPQAPLGSEHKRGAVALPVEPFRNG